MLHLSAVMYLPYQLFLWDVMHKVWYTETHTETHVTLSSPPFTKPQLSPAHPQPLIVDYVPHIYPTPTPLLSLDVDYVLHIILTILPVLLLFSFESQFISWAYWELLSITACH